jgi:hypothetical protein
MTIVEDTMEGNPAGRPCQIFIVRSRDGYQVVPPTHVTPRDSEVTFCNRARATMEVRLPSGVFDPDTITLIDGQAGTTGVRGPAGVYDYEVQDVGGGRDGFFAVGNSSPRIIVDP